MTECYRLINQIRCENEIMMNRFQRLIENDFDWLKNQMELFVYKLFMKKNERMELFGYNLVMKKMNESRC